MKADIKKINIEVDGILEGRLPMNLEKRRKWLTVLLATSYLVLFLGAVFAVPSFVVSCTMILALALGTAAFCFIMETWQIETGKRKIPVPITWPVKIAHFCLLVGPTLMLITVTGAYHKHEFPDLLVAATLISGAGLILHGMYYVAQKAPEKTGIVTTTSN